MSPSYSDHVCRDCFLFEQRGVCPAARRVYGLETPADVQQRAEALRVAIAEDAHAGRSLIDLIRRAGAAGPLPVRAATLLTPGSPEALTNEPSKEAINVVSSRPS